VPDGRRIPSDDELRAARATLAHIALVVATIAERVRWHARMTILNADTDHITVKDNLIDRAAGGSRANPDGNRSA